MRTYYIYRQDIRFAGIYDEIARFLDKFVYKYLPYEYIGYAEGTKELYKYFIYLRWKCEYFVFSDSFLYDSRELKTNGRPPKRYIIVDDKGKIRDYNELVWRHKKKRHYQKYRTPHQESQKHFIFDVRRDVTPEDYREYRSEYGPAVNFKISKHTRHGYLECWCWECHRKSRNWKDQTKRKKQWKCNK